MFLQIRVSFDGKFQKCIKMMQRTKNTQNLPKTGVMDCRRWRQTGDFEEPGMTETINEEQIRSLSFLKS